MTPFYLFILPVDFKCVRAEFIWLYGSIYYKKFPFADIVCTLIFCQQEFGFHFFTTILTRKYSKCYVKVPFFQIEEYATSKDMQICGYYHANEYYNDRDVSSGLCLKFY